MQLRKADSMAKYQKDNGDMSNAIGVSLKKNIPIVKKYIDQHKGTIKWIVIVSVLIFLFCKIKINMDLLPAILAGILAFVVGMVIFAYWGILTYTGTTYDSDAGVEVTKDSYECGSAERGTKREKDETFTHGTYATSKENFLGEDLRDGSMKEVIPVVTELYSMIEGFGINGNRIFFGSPGSGKSAALLINDIFQTIRRGESAVVSDTKGELYNITSVVARAYGYTTKILNLDPYFLVHSDACDPFQIIVEDLNQAPSFAETICANISEEVGFWADEQMNILTFFLLYVACNDIGIPKTLPGMFLQLNQATVEDIDDMGASLSDEHPAKIYYNNFAAADKTVKGNALGGLQVKLSKMGQPIMQKLFGTDEIDFKLPATEKCIYYVNLAANDRSNSYFSALFFDVLMREQESVARKLGGRCPIKIKYYMDEFYNLGIIPNMDNRLGTLRSAGIDIYLYLQSLGQLQKMYPDNQWEIIMECVSLVCLLKTNTNTTAEYLSKMCGVGTVKTRGIRKTRRKGTVGLIMEVMETESNTQRPTYFPDELRRMDNKELLVIPSGHNPFRFRKVLYTNHPMMELVRPVMSQEHIPDWVRDVDPEDYEKYGITDDTPFDEGEFFWDKFVKPLSDEQFEMPWDEKGERAKKLKKEIEKEKQLIQKEITELSNADETNESFTTYEPEEKAYVIQDEKHIAESEEVSLDNFDPDEMNEDMEEMGSGYNADIENEDIDFTDDDLDGF